MGTTSVLDEQQIVDAIKTADRLVGKSEDRGTDYEDRYAYALSAIAQMLVVIASLMSDRRER